MLDLLIIGAGPSGLACAIAAAKAGLKYLVVEKGVIANSIYRFPTNMTFFSTSQLLEIGDVPFISHSDKPTRQEALEYYRRVVDSYNLNIITFEEVDSVERSSGMYNVICSNTTYQAKNIVVSIGYYDHARNLNVPGEDLPKVKHYYDDAHPYIGKKVLVVGAANSACDVALETWHKGANVSMAIRESEIYPKVKYWIRPNIINRIKEGSIKAYFNTTVEEITAGEVSLKTGGKLFRIENDFVLAMTGYKPNYSLLKKIGIAIETDDMQTPVHDEETLESNLPNVYLAGVVGGGLQTSKLFIENTRHHGERIVKAIQAKSEKLS